MKPFKVDQIDHIHVYVAERYEAAEWYKRVLGMEIVKSHENWAVQGGPLTISSDGGKTGIALFARPKDGKNHSTIAYRISGQSFLDFLDRLPELGLSLGEDKIISRSDVVDHDHSYSIYFYDPYGNPIEITTYDYAVVERALKH
jgi:catechol 2,3-dioxygenase-like lactoylglutathione lyase family enzyme